MPDTMPTPENPEFWAERYRANATPWDLGRPAPPFETLLLQGTLSPGKMAVLGSGLGHDAALFGQHGFKVTGFDLTEEATDSARSRYGHSADFEQADMFTLADSPNAGQFDYVLEHTCFCAIPVTKRMVYEAVVRQLLKPGGHYIALFWLTPGTKDGPPHGSTRAEIRQLFTPDFEILCEVVPDNSVDARQGQELLVVMRRKACVTEIL